MSGRVGEKRECACATLRLSRVQWVGLGTRGTVGWSIGSG